MRLYFYKVNDDYCDFWLANDSKYENSYYDAISLSQNEYIRKKVEGY